MTSIHAKCCWLPHPPQVHGCWLLVHCKQVDIKRTPLLNRPLLQVLFMLMTSPVPVGLCMLHPSTAAAATAVVCLQGYGNSSCLAPAHLLLNCCTVSKGASAEHKEVSMPSTGGRHGMVLLEYAAPVGG
jgi:hypothetical protein